MDKCFTVATWLAVLGCLAYGNGCANEGAIAGQFDAGSNAAQDHANAHTLIPARVRRLSNAEYNGSVAALLDTDLTPGRGFAPDARQAGFTVNEAQRVDAVLAEQLFVAAQQLAADARSRFGEMAPCATPSDPEPCARDFITNFGARAYRRPLSEEEAQGLLEVFRSGAQDAGYEDGVELVVSALLQSGGFLYLTELGAASASAPAGSAVALTEYELASSLSYLMTGAPPDRALLDAAAAGELESPEARRSQLQRLQSEHPESRDHLVRTLREWLELDRIEFTAKDIAYYPTYELMWREFITESHAFIAAVLDQNPKATSDVSTLLSADWTVGDSTLAKFYEAENTTDGRLKLSKRRGVLNQGAFLAVHSHAYESAPVLRGALIARRLACIPVPAPATLGISVVAPPANPSLTTRQRFAAHDADPTCAQCHKTLDGFGNAFEQYDGMGALRQTENATDIDSTTTIALGMDFDGAYPDSNALAEALAGSATVRECFARFLFRAATARSEDSSRSSDTTGSEDAFIAEWQALPEPERGNVVDTLAAFVSSRLFTHRRAP